MSSGVLGKLGGDLPPPLPHPPLLLSLHFASMRAERVSPPYGSSAPDAIKASECETIYEFDKPTKETIIVTPNGG
jgi:hypothetical protein